jgi:malonate transporter and related proteins
MIEIINLALPYFGLIFIGFACGKLKALPESGLAWMNFFLLYVSLPALFFRIMSRTPFEQLNNVPFVLATTLATASMFIVSALAGRMTGIRSAKETIMSGLGGAYGNIGYMGPGLALSTVGQNAAVPVALIFCFDSILIFSLAPLLMALFGDERLSAGQTAKVVVRQIALNPLIMGSAAGAIAAAFHFQAPVAIDRTLEFLQAASAPVALFALGVTVALRPLARMPWELPAIIVVKLVLHPVAVFWLLLLLGPFPWEWVATALLMASLPPALSVFVLANQYNTWIEQASATVLVGTFVSVVTLTAMMWLIRSGQLAW